MFVLASQGKVRLVAAEEMKDPCNIGCMTSKITLMPKKLTPVNAGGLD